MGTAAIPFCFSHMRKSLPTLPLLSGGFVKCLTNQINETNTESTEHTGIGFNSTVTSPHLKYARSSQLTSPACSARATYMRVTNARTALHSASSRLRRCSPVTDSRMQVHPKKPAPLLSCYYAYIRQHVSSYHTAVCFCRFTSVSTSTSACVCTGMPWAVRRHALAAQLM